MQMEVAIITKNHILVYQCRALYFNNSYSEKFHKMLLYIKRKLRYSANAHSFTFSKEEKCKLLYFHSEWKDKVHNMTINTKNSILLIRSLVKSFFLHNVTFDTVLITCNRIS